MGGSNASSAAAAATGGWITAGNVTVAAQAVWATTGLTWTVPASPGQILTVAASPLIEWAAPASDYFDVCAYTGAGIVWRASSGTAAATTSDKGDVTFYPNPNQYRCAGSPAVLTVTAAMIVAGNVQFGVYSRGAGGATVYASTDYPLRWWALVT